MRYARHLLAAVADTSGELTDSTPVLQPNSDLAMLSRRQIRMIAIHGWLMAAAFCLLLPLGLVVAHGCRGMGRGWIWVHVVLQVLACFVSLAGIVLVSFIPISHAGHKSLGIVCQVLLGFQLIFGFARPSLQSRHRRLFNVSHWWMGRAAAAIGVAEVFYGLWLSQPPTAYFLTALFTLLAVGTLMVYRDLVTNLRLPPPAVALQVLQGAASPKAAVAAAATAAAAGAAGADSKDSIVVEPALEPSAAAVQMVRAVLEGEVADPLSSPRRSTSHCA